MLNTSNIFSEIMYSNNVITQRSTTEMTNIMQCTLTKSIKANSYFLFHSMRVLYLTKAIQYGKLLCEMSNKGSIKVNDSNLPYMSNLHKKIVNNRSIDLTCSDKITENFRLQYLNSLCTLGLYYGYKHIISLDTNNPVVIQRQLNILQKSVQKEIYPYTLKNLHNSNNDDFV